MRKKKYALALLTLAIGASLFGCGNKEASENKADTEAGAEVTESNKEEKAEQEEDSKKKKQYSYSWGPAEITSDVTEEDNQIHIQRNGIHGILSY